MKYSSHAVICTLGIVLAAFTAPTLAHHSAAAYDTQKEVQVTGTIKEYTFKNPHSYITLEVKNSDGTVTFVEVELGSAAFLGPLGFKKDSVAVGEVITVSGNPHRGSPQRAMLGKDVYKRDGSRYPLNVASRSVYTATTETARSIGGTWVSPPNEIGAFFSRSTKWPFTAKGQAAMANIDPKANIQKDCVPIGIPSLMFYPVANTIVLRPDRVIMQIDWMDSERTIYLDGRGHPPASEVFLQGHSVGRWDGDVLVVETTNFREHPQGLTNSLPSSSRKRVTERFQLAPDGRGLIYAGTIEDPVYLTQPVDWTARWEYRPNMPHSNQKCDLEIARRFLQDTR